MVKILQERILDNGFTVLNSEQTREKNHPNENPSCLDLIFTNRKDKIIMHDTVSPTFSDHFLLIVKRRTKNIIIPKQFIKIRSFKNFQKSIFQENILNHHDYINNFHEKDPNLIAEGLQKIIQNSLDPIAPVKRILITKKKCSNNFR